MHRKKLVWKWVLLALAMFCALAQTFAISESSALITTAAINPAFSPSSQTASTRPAQKKTPSIPAAVESIYQDVWQVATFGPDRSAGSPGATLTEKYYAEQLARQTDHRVWTQPFSEALPKAIYCHAVDPDHSRMTIPLDLLLPNGGQLPALLPRQTLAAPVVYAGNGSLPELDGLHIAHAWVAMDVTGADHWVTIAGLGARGIIFLGSPRTSFTALRDTIVHAPVTLPRLYTQNQQVVAAIRAGQIHRLAIQFQAGWFHRIGRNLLCLIPASANRNAVATSGTLSQRSVIVLTARYDASSCVLSQCPGAQQDIGAAILTALSHQIAAAKLPHPVLIALLADNEWGFLGERQLLRLLKTSPEKITQRIHLRRTTDHKIRDILTMLQTMTNNRTVILTQTSASLRSTLENEIQSRVSNIQSQINAQRMQSSAVRNVSLMDKLEKKEVQLLDAQNAVHSGHRLNRSLPNILRAAARLIPKWRIEATNADQRLAMAEKWRSIRMRFGPDKIRILVQMNIHLTSHGHRFGFFSRSDWLPLDLSSEMSQFDSLLNRSYYNPARRLAAKLNLPFNAVFDTRTTQTMSALADYFPIPTGFCSDYALWRGIASGTFATVRDDSGLIDTPNDTPEQINWRSLAKQFSCLKLLLLGSHRMHSHGALTDPDFAGRVAPQDATDDQTLTLLQRSFGQTVASVGAPFYLVGASINTALTPLEGTRRTDWKFSRRNGFVRFDRLPLIGGIRLGYQLQAYKFAADGFPLSVLAGNVGVAGYSNGVFSPDNTIPLRCLVFKSLPPINLYGLFDPRYLDHIDDIQVLDARKAGAPKFFNTLAYGSAGVAYVQPNVPWQLIISHGEISNRMLLINADQHHPLGTGFFSTNVRNIGPLSWRTANDMYYLDANRKDILAKYGITSHLADTFYNAALGNLHSGVQARKQLHYNRWLGEAAASWSLQVQAYHALISDSNGIVDGVIFLLLGLIPFSYFLERLLIGSPNVYRQIGGFAIIFALMTAVLASFHPAFRITTAPLMILLAFVILLLSAVVIHILFQKFENELSRLRSSGAASHQDNVKRSAVLGAAVRLGLSNMRRRGTRTTMTLITLVLLTFTLLCFTSLRQDLTLTPSVESNAPHHPPVGILLRQRAWLSMSPDALALARQIAGSKGLLAPVFWYASTDARSTWRLSIVPVKPYALIGAIPSVAGLVGFAPQESAFFTNITTQLPGWSQIAAGKNVCLLPDVMHGKPYHRNDHVRILGRTLTIAGFFPTRHFTLRQITGEPILPVDAAGSSQGNQVPINLSARQLAALPEPNLAFMNPDEVAILPAKIVRNFGGVFTSAMILPQDSTAKTIFHQARLVARRSAFSVIASNGQRVLAYNAVASSTLSDLSSVLVPLAIAAVIVLNTMLGAVAERTREIHVYTSLGLAPSHVGMLFLAEAAALGTLGVVFGYVCGQAVATLLSYTHLISGVHLNYSSMSAILTMGLVLALVMASTIWPARMASRVAAPSLQRDWKLPAPKDDLLCVDLPFTVNAVAARGVCKFIEEFFSDVSQSGVGRFTAEHIEAFTQDGVRGLSARLWLAPYDLGVIQYFWLAIHATAEPNVFEVKITLRREAGSPSAWMRLNRPFMAAVRKQFLLWRSVSPEMVQRYVNGSEAMFAHAGQRVPPVAA